MKIDIEELKKQGLTNLAALLESKVNENNESVESDKNNESTNEDNKETNMKDALDKLFEGVEGIPEDFADKLKVTFIANVNERAEELVAEKITEIEEQTAKALEEQAKEQEQSLNTYLTYVAEAWLEENKEAVESNIQTKRTESFIKGLRELFEEHAIEIPEDKADVVEQLETELAESKGVIDALTKQMSSLKEDLDDKEKSKLVESACSDLTETESEKFRKLAHEFLNEDVESFARKVSAIKEYFKAETTPETKKVEESVTEVDVPEDKPLVEADVTSKTKVVDPKMQSYLAALRKGSQA